MELSLAAAGASVGAVAALSPRSAAALALPLFGRIARPRPMRPGDEPTMWRATRGSVRIPGVDRRGTDVDTFEWGAGPRTVVLAHGWNGRASQFSTLVRELVADDWRVVSFDAPAHGGSGGRRAYLVDWLDVLTELQQRHGAFEAVVGHSFGGLAALVGVAGGTEAARVVTVAAPADADLLLSQFQGMLGYSDTVAAIVRERFARTYFPGESDPFARLSTVRRPLPPQVSLLVAHDAGDRVVPFAESGRIVAANPRAGLLATTGLGHNRILTADVFLDAVLAHLRAPVAPVVGTTADLPAAVSVAA